MHATGPACERLIRMPLARDCGLPTSSCTLYFSRGNSLPCGAGLGIGSANGEEGLRHGTPLYSPKPACRHTYCGAPLVDLVASARHGSGQQAGSRLHTGGRSRPKQLREYSLGSAYEEVVRSMSQHSLANSSLWTIGTACANYSAIRERWRFLPLIHAGACPPIKLRPSFR